MLTKKHALDDDFESPRNVVTESNVDYLSYKFDEMDLAASWRVLTKQKLNIVNGIRLENASWRTWAKQRNNLKTVSPDTLNWLKDSDVTWLYGPLHTVIKEIGDTDRYAKPKVSTTEDTLGLMMNQAPAPPLSPSPPPTSSKKEEKRPMENSKQSRPSASPLQGHQKPLKSALKKVTMSDILKRSASELQINKEDSSNISISEANQQLGAFSPAVIASHRQPKLRFNQYVEQCVALGTDETSKKKGSRLRMVDLNDATTDTNEEDDTSDSYEPGDESDAGSIMIHRKPNKVRSSIKKIEPALLKTNSRSDPDLSSSDDDEDEMIIPTISSSHKKHRSNNTNYQQHHGDWDAESAESDALLNHIISVSKGKQPVRNRGDQQDIIAGDDTPIQWEEQITEHHVPGKSDYEYEFDDDDWDTSSEHVEDVPFTAISEDRYASPSPPPPVAAVPHIYQKAAAVVNEPVPHVRPTTERSLSNTSATEELQQDNRNNSLFSHIAHWASSHLWPPSEEK
ncbi:uncharacterized protein EV154DRAFT_457685 [Mucor mucedo]|uniref:uncharacterized protein n=1 Tax=Mucor mucedo TaxID=29922 RepID=UPI0022210D3D|nr:uncharacterized protein EV154DRAFT_457685 [Mucor mucedo]KAI7895565.1 hypothetical protein EV154DRAFT_457685 [Mucor mucedo]